MTNPLATLRWMMWLVCSWRSGMNKDKPPLTPDVLGELTETLLNDPNRFEAFVECRVDAKLRTPPEEDPSWSEQDEEERQGRKGSIMRTVRTQLATFSARSSQFETYLGLWIHRTVLMSFGVACVGAMQRLSGGDSNEIGYGLTDESWNGNDTTLLLFDRAECGNGNVSVAKEFMHIPNIIRAGARQPWWLFTKLGLFVNAGRGFAPLRSISL